MANEFQLQLNQAVQIELEDHTTRYSAVLTNFLQNQVVVRFPQYSQMPEGLQVDQPVLLRCIHVTGLRVGKSRIVELCAPPRPGVILELPPQFETIQKRHYFRVEVDFPCQLQEMRTGGAAGCKDGQARLLDISVGGARVSTSCALKMGDRVQVEFVPQGGPASGARDAGPKTGASAKAPIPPRPPVRPLGGRATPTPSPMVIVPSIRATGSVVRIVPVIDGPPGFLQVGVEFEKLHSSTEERLVNLVFDMQRMQLHS